MKIAELKDCLQGMGYQLTLVKKIPPQVARYVPSTIVKATSGIGRTKN
ncbi:hypothetical protein COO91_03071 [Nostoc flagelliforme CCNUN1]|uniref:Uncharacterized protein n=1 Tax=Nostoc flagelliforme CCNUN1 TaxID=2038116 RepID=A0A2K8SQQ1_9NOSO|nr:hypothetical protein COO91_03071 [Nostoc flagelliforme CCNUN1]